MIGYTNFAHAELFKKLFERPYFRITLLPDPVGGGEPATHGRHYSTGGTQAVHRGQYTQPRRVQRVAASRLRRARAGQSAKAHVRGRRARSCQRPLQHGLWPSWVPVRLRPGLWQWLLLPLGAGAGPVRQHPSLPAFADTSA